MTKSTRDIVKSKRPKAPGEPVMVRLQEPLSKSIDLWRAKQDDLPSRPEAIRRLVEQALKATDIAYPRKSRP